MTNGAVPQEDAAKKPAARGRPNCVSRLFFFWVNSFVATANKRALEAEDMFEIPDASSATDLLERFDKTWGEVRSPGAKPTQKPLEMTFRRLFKGAYVRSGMLIFLQNTLQVSVPLLCERFLIWFSDSSATDWHGWAIGGGAFLAVFLGNLCGNHSILYLYMGGMDMRSLCNVLIYRKALRLSQKARSQTTTGQIVTLMSADCERLPMAVLTLHSIWMAPMFIIVTSTLLILTIGVAGVVGLAVMLLTIPLPVSIAKKQFGATKDQMKCADARTKAINEALQGVKVLKYYAWDAAYAERVAALRQMELAQVRRLARLGAASIAIIFGAPLLMALAMVVTFFFMNPEDFTPARVFTALGLLALVRMPLGMLPMALKGLADARASFQRLQRFLLLEEREDVAISTSSLPTPAAQGQLGQLRLEGATFQWDPVSKEDILAVAKGKGKGKGKAAEAEEKKAETEEKEEEGFALRNVSLQASSGQLCAVVGEVGSGKSSLLGGMLRDMPLKDGKATLEGSVAYCAQNAWVLNATLRDNVLFGQEYDEARYIEAMDMCCLGPDCQALASADLTEIGEKGVTLSGGQKARVSLARAVYSRASVLLLDDVLSAVDSETGRHIWEHCICVLKARGSLIILATNQVHLLDKADVIWGLKDGAVAEQGTLAELAQAGGVVTHLLSAVPSANIEVQDGAKRAEEWDAKMEKRMTFTPSTAKVDTKTAELKREGNVSWRVWWFYFVTCNGGVHYPVALFSLIFMAQAIKNLGEWWLSYWTDKATEEEILEADYHMAVYAAFGVVTMLAWFFRGISIAEMILRSARSLHSRMLQSVLGARMDFFDTTPLGRITNRFTKDIDGLDTQMQRCMPTFFIIASDVLGVLLTVGITMPLFFAGLLPLAAIYWHVQTRFRPVARDIQRLESVSRSPIFAQFSETLQGISTIRAYGRTSSFFVKCVEAVNVSNKAFVTMHVSNRWLQIRLETLSSVFLLAVVAFGIQGRSAGTVSTGVIGLTLLYAQSLGPSLNFGLRMATETEARMTSAERIYEYITEIEQEAPRITETRPPASWPQHGEVEFRKVCMRYRPDLPLVLNNLTFKIAGGSKIGICGRTGCGKSTLLNVLFRVLDIARPKGGGEGEILIDGLDISKMGLHDLRHRLAIIPQDAVMFAGTLKENLDLFGQYSEEDLWSALRFSALDDTVKQMPDGLNSPVQEGGENLSCGQRQLICLARALLRKSKIVCLDEATANIDVKTDETIQQVIRKEFEHCTVLTIAHRLQTIAHSDKILFLEHGTVGEYDAPATLLAKPDSRFRALVDEMGPEAAAAMEGGVQQAAADLEGVQQAAADLATATI